MYKYIITVSMLLIHPGCYGLLFQGIINMESKSGESPCLFIHDIQNSWVDVCWVVPNWSICTDNYKLCCFLHNRDVTWVREEHTLSLRLGIIWNISKITIRSIASHAEIETIYFTTKNVGNYWYLELFICSSKSSN